VCSCPDPPSPTRFPYPTLSRSALMARAVPVEVRRQTIARVLRRIVELRPPRGEQPEALETERGMQPADAGAAGEQVFLERKLRADRKSTRLNSSHVKTSYAVFC